MLNNGKRHFVKEMHEIHGGLGVRHSDDLAENFHWGSLPGVCLWAHCGSTWGGFILALTVCEFRAIFFVSSQ